MWIGGNAPCGSGETNHVRVVWRRRILACLSVKSRFLQQLRLVALGLFLLGHEIIRRNMPDVDVDWMCDPTIERFV